MNKSVVYLPGLNGLRAIAALSVVFSHISIQAKILGLTKFGGWGFATHGVTLFFTISGFLITYLLLLEKEQKRIMVKRFYVRRILRIWPLYYLYLLISILFLGKYFEWDSTILYYLFFCANIPYIFESSIFLIAHLWTIGVEEQFYLIWPIMVKFTNKRLIVITFVVTCFLILLKFYARYIIENNTIMIFLSVNRFECMLIGAMGAMLFYCKNNVFRLITTHRLTQLIAWLFILLIAFGKISTPGPTEQVTMSLITLLLILGQISPEKKIINLENRYFDFLGKISYGISLVST